MSSTYNDNFTSSFPIWIHFLFLIWLLWLYLPTLCWWEVMSVGERAAVQVNGTGLGRRWRRSLSPLQHWSLCISPSALWNKIIHVTGWHWKCQPEVLTTLGTVCLTLWVSVYTVHRLAVPRREVLLIHLLLWCLVQHLSRARYTD